MWLASCGAEITQVNNCTHNMLEAVHDTHLTHTHTAHTAHTTHTLFGESTPWLYFCRTGQAGAGGRSLGSPHLLLPLTPSPDQSQPELLQLTPLFSGQSASSTPPPPPPLPPPLLAQTMPCSITGEETERKKTEKERER